MNPALSAFRFYLAICVLTSHFGGPGIWGFGAVEAFFCISGFLVTMIVKEPYAGRPGAYLLNRFLRIYPIYWVCLALSCLVVIAFPAVAASVNRGLMLPTSPLGWLSQLAIFGLYVGHHVAPARLLPPAWSLNIELYFYLVIGLVTATRPRLTAILAMLSLLVCVLSAARILTLPYYGDPIGNAQPFFLGSLAYQVGGRVKLSHLRTALLLGVFLIIHLTHSWRFLEARVIGASLLAPVLVLGMWQTNLGLKDWQAKLCDLIGKLSYPIFLLHWVVAVPFEALRLGRMPTFLLTLVTTIFLSWLVHLVIEAPLEKLRTTIRRARRSRQDATPMLAHAD